MNSRRTNDIRPAFTLLELIIASALTATMMLIAWSLFSVFTKLNDKGVEKATELQLVRSLMAQLRADMRHLVRASSWNETHSTPPTLSIATVEPNMLGPSPLPAGPWLIGNETSLRFLIRSNREQPVRLSQRTEELHVTGAPSPASRPLEPAAASIVYEMIEYEWRPPPQAAVPPSRAAKLVEVEPLQNEPRIGATMNLQANAAGPDAWETGLTRRATPWMKDLGLDDPSHIAIHGAADLNRHSDLSPEETAVTTVDESRTTPVFNTETDRVPETSRLHFRYYDGESWFSEWDSLTAQGLPASIEVTFDLEPQLEPRVPQDDELETNASDVIDSVDGGQNVSRTEYRFVIVIDTARPVDPHQPLVLAP